MRDVLKDTVPRKGREIKHERLSKEQSSIAIGALLKKLRRLKAKSYELKAAPVKANKYTTVNL